MKNTNEIIGHDFHVFRCDECYFLFSLPHSAIIEIKDELLYCLFEKYEEYLNETETTRCKTVSQLLNEYDWPEEKKNNIKNDVIELLPYTHRDNGHNSIISAPPINSKCPQHLRLGGLTLILAETCNLNCDYCYTSIPSKKVEPLLMSKGVARKSIDFLFARLAEARKDINILFFGGEPLLNKSVLIATMEYTKKRAEEIQKGATFNITTNGTLLTKDFIEYFHDNNGHILVSMDGNADTHNKYRTFCDGSGSHQVILDNIQHLKEYTGHLSVRATWRPDGPSMAELRDYFKEIGVTELIITVLAATEDNNSDGTFSTTLKKYETVQEQYSACLPTMYKDAIDRKKSIWSPFSHNFSFFNSMTQNQFGYQCNCGLNGSAVTSDGTIFPCHRFWGMDSYSIGNIYEGFDTKKYQAFWKQYYDDVTYKCIRCWARYHCSGGCINRYSLNSGNFSGIPDWDCDMRKKGLEQDIFYFAKLSKENPDVLMELCGQQFNDGPWEFTK